MNWIPRIMISEKLTLVQRFFMAFIPATLIVAIVIAGLFYNDRRLEEAVIKVESQERLDKYRGSIVELLRQVSSDVLVLANYSSLQYYVEQPSKSRLTYVLGDFRIFLKNKSEFFFKARYIDETGQEIISIWNLDGTINILPDDSLQMKRKRYYFRDSITLKRDMVFVSPLDLNLEHGKIINPITPTIRFATPVFDEKNQKQGVVVLSFRGDILLNKIVNELDVHLGDINLLNSDGYYLKCNSPEKEWGFMYDNKKDLTFKSEQPAVWDNLLKYESGQFFHKKNLYTFFTISPLMQGQISSTGADKWFKPSLGIIGADSYKWKLVSVIDKAAISKNPLQRARASAAAGLVTIFLVGILIWTGLKFNETRKSEKEELFNTRDRLEALVKGSPLGIIAFDIEGRIKLWNPAAQGIFGLSFTDIQSTPELLLENENLRVFKGYFTQVLGGEMLSQLEMEALSQNGDSVSLSFSLAPLHSHEGKVTGIICVLADITEKKRAERALQERQQLEVIKILARTVAHEFRQPLAAMKLMFDLFEVTDDLEDVILKAKKTAPNLVDRMDNLVERLLNITKVENKQYLPGIDILELPEAVNTKQDFREKIPVESD